MVWRILYIELGGGGDSRDKDDPKQTGPEQESETVADTTDSLTQLQEHTRQQEEIIQLAGDLSDLLVRTRQIMNNAAGQGGYTSGQGNDGTSQGHSDDRVDVLLAQVNNFHTLDDVKNFLRSFISLLTEQGSFPGWEELRDSLKANALTAGLLGPIIRECYENALNKLTEQEYSEKKEALTMIIDRNRVDLAHMALEVSRQSASAESRESSSPHDWKNELEKSIGSLMTQPENLSHVQEIVCSRLVEKYALSSDAEKDLQNAVKYLLLDVISQARSPGGATGACTSYAAVLSLMA
ncbi:MAG: hypothetical protein NZL83_04175 [Candidatus Absconditabacterales bacterium]|nr:hypothetical protein [Candidatus Absconditabacterales bacterium]